MGLQRRAAVVLAAGAALQGLAVIVFLSVERARRPARGTFPMEAMGVPAADLESARADGSKVRLKELLGRPVLVHFWATWCPPCREEMPALLALARRLRREVGLELLAVSLDDRWESIDRFFSGRAPAEVLKTVGQGHRAFQVTQLPDSYLIARDGSLRARIAGPRDWRSPAAYDALREAVAWGEDAGAKVGRRRR